MSDAGKKAQERAKRIIRELQNKTVENGCTEQEALAAATQVGELLQKYDLEIDEVGVREDAAACKKNEVFAADAFAGGMIVGIGRFCTLIVYQQQGSGHGCKYVLFGTPHDLEIARYLYEICAEAMDADWARYMEVHGYSMKKRASFRAGFSERIGQRMVEMKNERDRRNASASRSLVVLKDQLVKSEFGKLGIKLGSARGTRVADPHAYREGQSAAGRVNLNNPIEGGGPGADRLR